MAKKLGYVEWDPAVGGLAGVYACRILNVVQMIIRRVKGYGLGKGNVL